jgi:hypothetical protein
MGFLQNILSRLKKPQPTIRERSIFEQLIQAERDSAVERSRFAAGDGRLGSPVVTDG